MATAANGAQAQALCEEYVYRARLAEQAERFEEMAEFMKKVAETKKEILSMEERNLLSIAYKNMIGYRRAAWRVIQTLESKEKQKVDSCKEKSQVEEAKRHENQARYCKEYRVKIEHELLGTCREVLNLLNAHLLPVANPDVAEHMSNVILSADKFKERNEDSVEKDIQKQLDDFEEKSHFHTKIANAECLVFYWKMMGDYYRYLSEHIETERVAATARSLASYYVASEVAKVHLKPTDPVRLGLALNCSVFYYEILSQADRACQLAKNAFDEAISELDQLEESSYKDSTLIMQLLRDNLLLWTADMNDNAAEEVAQYPPGASRKQE